MRNTIRQSRSRRAALVLAAAGASFALTSHALALDIIMNFNSGASTNPPADMGATLLQAHMAAVETFYEDVSEDSHTLTINYWYGTQGGGILAAHTLGSQSGGRETSGQIVFSPNAAGNDWFFDPTPANNTEFNMSQTLWRNLSAANQAAFYNSAIPAPPATFESGFTGTNNATNPNVAGNTDLLSVAMHETGHALGMSSANSTTVAETGDGDYDFDTVNVFGRTLAARIPTVPSPNPAHLAGSSTVMFPSIGTSIRRLPGHTDLFSMAAVHDYFTLDVPRREFYGGAADWNTNANWSGNRAPGADDDAFVRANGTIGAVNAGLSADAVAGNLTVSDGAAVTTNSFSLAVTNTVNVIGGGGSTVLNFNGGSFSCATLNVSASAQVLLTAGGNKVLRAGAVSVITSGKIDMSDNDAVINYPGASQLTNIRTLITQGYNGGLWTGNGITSSAAAAAPGAHKTALGYGEVSVIGAGTFTGTDASTVLIRYVYVGDANLDATVDTIDFNNLSANFSLAGKVWTDGDFDYNQTVDSVDFNLLASNFSLVLPSSPGDFANTLVPETTSALIALAACGLNGRRRHRK